MNPPRRIAAFARAVVALALIGVLAAGVPLLLIRAVGWPLPTAIPTYAQVRMALAGGLTDRFWLKLFAVVIWLAWAQLMVAVLLEVVAFARGRVVRPRVADAWAQHVATRLVGAVALAVTLIGPVPGAGARTLPDAVASVTSAPAAVPEPVAPGLVGEGASTSHIVVRGESLSSIAADELGDQTEWPRIWTANRGRSFGSRVFHDPDLILPGWDLTLPRFEAPVTDPPPPDLVAPAPVTPVLLPPVVITAPSTPAPPSMLASPSTLPPSTAPATPATLGTGFTAPRIEPADPTADRDTAPTWTRYTAVLGASLLATGIAATLAGRRRRALRGASSSTATLVADTELAPLVSAVHASSDALRMTRLELALRALAGRLAAGASAARPIAVRADAAGRVELTLDRAATLDAPWEVGADGRCWGLPGEVSLTSLTDDARGVSPPCPALVGVGRDDDGEVFIDLEALAVLGLPKSEAGVDLARLLVATLAVTPLADELRVIVVGSELPELGWRHDVRTVPDVASAVAEVEMLTAGIAGATNGSLSTFRLRATAGHEAWEPVVVVVPTSTESRDDLARLLDLARAHRGVAVVGAGLDEATWRLIPAETGWRLEPLGWSLRLQGLNEAETAEIDAAFTQAAEPVVEGAAVVASGPPIPSAPSWSLMVRVLGTVDVVDPDGRPVAFERARSLELVVWLAQHAGTASRAGARAALWGLDVSNASFSNVVSEARRAMARLVPPPDGDDWLARTYAERLPLHPAVVLDADLVAAHLHRARGLPDEAAIAELRSALRYVRGAPYAGTTYLWPDAEALPSTLTLLATTVAAELAERCLANDDLEEVFAATAVGLEVLPGHEELVALRMRAHAARGDRAAVRGEFASYEQAIASDLWAGGELAPKLVELRKELVGVPVPVAGS